jgi:heavy metal translocating P-type ATPase
VSEARLDIAILGVALGTLVLSVVLRLAGATGSLHTIEAAALVIAGVPLVFRLARLAFAGQFGSDLLAGISIATAFLLGEYVAGLLVVTMLTGGTLIERQAVARASGALRALADRMPRTAHRVGPDGPEDMSIDAIVVGQRLAIFPHETVPVDGIVVSGQTRMNEAFLTGEPWEIEKAPGSEVISGAINGEHAIEIEATRLPADSRYATILGVLRESEQQRPRMRRLGDQLGAIYTPIALLVAGAAWLLSGEATRFLAVLVVATPCPLLIAIPVAIVGAVSQAARRGIVVRDPGILERIDRCTTLIIDKTGTLTAGRPTLVGEHFAEGIDGAALLAATASLERFSRHPLAVAVVEAAEKRSLPRIEVQELSEAPGRGLIGTVAGRQLEVTDRRRLLERFPALAESIPPITSGLECVVVEDGKFAAIFRFADAPRPDGKPFISHLGPRHGFDEVLIVSGDREAEVRAVASALGITTVFAEQSPSDKVRIVREYTARAPTLFVGDGINDAPALAAATAGVAFGRANEVSAQAAQAVVLDPSLERLDELMHLGARLRRVSLQSAVGGMLVSLIAMGFAGFGLLSPIAGALLQEGIDLAAVLNALRTSVPATQRTDLFLAGRSAGRPT